MRGVRKTGSSNKSPGMGGAPSGLPKAAALRDKSILGRLETTALLPEFSNNPPATHFFMISISLSGSLLLGGIVGSAAWVTTLTSDEPSRSPPFTITPELPPLSVAP